MMIIKPMCIEHIEEILEIENQSLHYPANRYFYISELEQDKAHLYVVMLDQVLCGYIDYWIILDEIHLQKIVIHPKYRRQKLAMSLFNYMLGQHPQMHKIYLEVEESNKGAKAFYDTMGFAVIGRRAKYYKGMGDALVMEKMLQ